MMKSHNRFLASNSNPLFSNRFLNSLISHKYFLYLQKISIYFVFVYRDHHLVLNLYHTFYFKLLAIESISRKIQAVFNFQ